jgi:hypothetical protein
MIIDEMTKLLSSQKHKKLIKQLRLVIIKHLIEINDAKSSNWDANWGSKLCEHWVSSYFKSGISIRKTDFRASMLISTAKHFFTKAIISEPFQHRFQSLFRSIFSLFNPLMIIMNRRFDRRFDWLVQLYFKAEEVCYDTMIFLLMKHRWSYSIRNEVSHIHFTIACKKVCVFRFSAPHFFLGRFLTSLITKKWFLLPLIATSEWSLYSRSDWWRW